MACFKILIYRTNSKINNENNRTHLTTKAKRMIRSWLYINRIYCYWNIPLTIIFEIVSFNNFKCYNLNLVSYLRISCRKISFFILPFTVLSLLHCRKTQAHHVLTFFIILPSLYNLPQCWLCVVLNLIV